jgi:serine/threonine protein kinase
MQPDPLGLVGTTVSGRYRVQEIVETTQLSVVYRAAHRVWRRPVPIKVFRAAELEEQDRGRFLESFVREGELLMELSERCASICQARDVASLTTPSGEWAPYMVLEWMEGETLDALLVRERQAGVRPRKAREAVCLLDPVARALALAHEHGIAHRDLKPGNVFVLPGGCKLLDFGVAQSLRDSSASEEPWKEMSFTPQYAAPEQFNPVLGATGPWTDVFALALVFVEVVTGRLPLGEGSNVSLARSSCDPKRRPTPSSLGVQVEGSVERVLERALAVRSEDRFDNARDFWSALKEAAPSAWADFSGTIPIPLRRRKRQWL